MWLEEVETFEEEYLGSEVFHKYKPALISMGVDLRNEEVQFALSANFYDLETSIRSAIAYVKWLDENNQQIHANAILIKALTERWKPMSWDDKYLELPLFESPGQRWWKFAIEKWGYDVRNRLVVDIFYSGDREYIKFSNGKEILVETAWLWGWERVWAFATQIRLANFK